MKNLTFVVTFAFLASILTFSQSGVISEEPLDEVGSYSLIDALIKAILEGMRPKLANLTFEDINEAIRDPSLNATINITKISLKNADKFEIKALKSSLIPLKIVNLTLTWDDIIASADYDLDAIIDVPSLNYPFKLFGKGNAKANLNQLFFTIGANVELKNNAIQIKDNGLFGFNIRIETAEVTVTSLMGSSDLGKAVGDLVSKFIPKAVDVLKNPLFDAFQADIIRIVNQLFLKQKNLLMNEEPKPLLETLEPFERNWDLNEENDDFFEKGFDLEMEEYGFKFEPES